MSDWRSMDTAPTDGTKIMARNEKGEIRECWRQQLHPKVEMYGWVASEDRSNPNWVGHEMFYPTLWHPLASIKKAEGERE